VKSEHRASDVAADGGAVAVSSSVKLSVRQSSCRTIGGARTHRLCGGDRTPDDQRGARFADSRQVVRQAV